MNPYITCYRNFIVGVNTKIPLSSGKLSTAINFDNAATTPPFVTVMQEINNFAPWYSSVHRGKGYKSIISSELFEETRLVVLDFVNADPNYNTVIFVKNTTEAINKLSYRLCNGNRNCVVLSTSMEHHSNDLPWRSKYDVDYVQTDSCGRLSLDDLESKLVRYKGRVKLVTVTGASNVTGYINPIHSIAELAHKYGAKICVDGAQLVPHMQVNMMNASSNQHIDYLVFSAHKMYAPFGIGVLVGPKETFEKGNPEYRGGGTVKVVTQDFVQWEDPPHKEEAGSPNILGIAALLASIRTLNFIGMKNIELHEKKLTEYVLLKLKELKDISLYGNTSDAEDRVGIVPFNIDGVYHDMTASILSNEGGIAVRNGCFCSQPYIQRLLNISKQEIKKYSKDPEYPRPGMVRISFGLYNNFEEIDILTQLLTRIIDNKELYIKKYSTISSY